MHFPEYVCRNSQARAASPVANRNSRAIRKIHGRKSQGVPDKSQTSLIVQESQHGYLLTGYSCDIYKMSLIGSPSYLHTASSPRRSSDTPGRDWTCKCGLTVYEARVIKWSHSHCQTWPCPDTGDSLAMLLCASMVCAPVRTWRTRTATACCLRSCHHRHHGCRLFVCASWEPYVVHLLRAQGG